MYKRGLTLIEVIVVMSIFAVASIVIGSIYISHNKFYTIESAAADIKTQKSIFTQDFKETAESATSVAASYVFNGITRSSSSSTIVFKLPAIDGSGNIIAAKFDYAAFYGEGNKTYLETAPDAASIRKNIKRQLADTAQDLNFRYDTALPQDAEVVGVSLYLKNGNEEAKIDASVHLRNK